MHTDEGGSWRAQPVPGLGSLGGRARAVRSYRGWALVPLPCPRAWLLLPMRDPQVRAPASTPLRGARTADPRAWLLLPVRDPQRTPFASHPALP